MIRRLLVANRGEIAIRIARTAAELGIATVSVHAEDDALALHTHKTDSRQQLRGNGPAAYLDIDQIVGAALESGSDAIHPGYGFLSENPELARRCRQAGLVFVGPAPETLALFGDKAEARAVAKACSVPVLEGSGGAVTLDQAAAFLASLGPKGAIMLKAVAGGGGRGMRPVFDVDSLADAYERCRSEALKAFGNGDLYAEAFVARARHVEVQVVGDGSGRVCHLWDRECSLQRQQQKLVEVAPVFGLQDGLREQILAAALRIAAQVQYRNIGTFEFLVAAGGEDSRQPFVFIEANPRLQVEHTVTEEVTGLDLVELQLAIANGATLERLGLGSGPPPSRGTALQMRINMETMTADGASRPAGGTISTYEFPSGRGIRVDGFGYAGYRTSPRYDSLLAKLIVHVPGGLPEAVNKAYRALCEVRIAGLPTNIPFLQNVLRHPAMAAGEIHTRFIEQRIGELLPQAAESHRRFYVEPASEAAAKPVTGRAVSDDPLAVLAHGKQGADEVAAAAPALDQYDGARPVVAPLQGTIVSVAAMAGDAIRAGSALLVIEAMKMEHVIEAPFGGRLRHLAVAAGDMVTEGQKLLLIEESGEASEHHRSEEAVDLDEIRPDLAELLQRRSFTLDENRPQAVARRRKTGQRTARENIADLCDPDSFVEFGGLVVAGRRRRNSMDELIRQTPADGMVMGLGRVNGDKFPDEASRCIVMSYDYTVLAGTQGDKNHDKKDRIFHLARQHSLPLVFFTEGGGGRPGETDMVIAGGLHSMAYRLIGELSGLVPLIGVNSGRCFAGNAVMLGCCDVIIATANSTIGMGGPAMIEGGGLGIYTPEEVGPMSMQVPNGVVDIAVADEAEAVAAARKYLSYFQGTIADAGCADQRLLRRAVPENRMRAYDMRHVVETLADTGSVLELRRGFGAAIITSFARIAGRPIGVMASNPMHLGGAIDSDAADKAAHFMQLCDGFDIPMVFLCDTPGNMVGPDAEKTALVRHCSRMFVAGANLSVPIFSVVLRKAYGLGAQGMAGGSFHSPFFSIAWPTAEFGGMGVEGAVKLGYRKELAAIEDIAARKAEYERMVADMYEQGKALNAASLYEVDDVIDPSETRRWLLAGLRAAPPATPRQGKKRAWIDTW